MVVFVVFVVLPFPLLFVLVDLTFVVNVEEEVTWGFGIVLVERGRGDEVIAGRLVERTLVERTLVEKTLVTDTFDGKLLVEEIRLVEAGIDVAALDDTAALLLTIAQTSYRADNPS